MTAAFAYSAIPRRRARLITDVVPCAVLVEWSCKLHTIMNLAWQYVDTVCDLCIQMRLPDTKPLVRAVRELRREYDRFRQSSLRDSEVERETERSLDFEDAFGDDFKRLLNGISNETGRLGLATGHRHLVVAVQQAMTLLDAVRVYARRCDAEMRGGVRLRRA